MNARFLHCTVLLFLWVSASAQPNADFKTAGPTQGCSPLPVVFQDLSTGGATSWSWNFGNGNSSSLKNPAAVYVNPGVYTVTLTATNASGSDIETKTAYISVFASPTANFSASSLLSGCAPLTVNFVDLTVPGTGGIKSWFWDFGDGKSSQQQNPTHTYLSGGIHTVTLVVIDSNGCTDTYFISNYVNVTDVPVAKFTSNNNIGCSAPHTVNFTSTTTGGQTPYSMSWNFGDGGTGSGLNPSHTYQNTGTYTVQLTVTDANGCTASTSYPNYVKVTQINTAFTQSNTSTCVGHAVQFTDQTTGGPTAWNWNFGNGSSNSQNPTNVWNIPGTYTVSLTASDGPCTDTHTKTGLITVHPLPIVDFTLAPKTWCSVPWSMSYKDNTPAGVSWLWLFGDGSNSMTSQGNHVYNSFGKYQVTLAVTNSNGCSNTKSDIVDVCPPKAAFTQSGLVPHGCMPLSVSFYDTSTSCDTIVSWFWDFGDGNTSTLQNPTHIYTTKCKHTVMLVITTSGGCKDTIIKNDLVWVGTPQNPYFVVDTIGNCVNGPIQFTDSSTGTIDAWQWSFGDGGISTGQNPSYGYVDTGCFKPTLTVFNCGCPASYTYPGLLCIDPPVVYFGLDSGTAKSCTAPHTVKFFNNSVGALSWLWNFGDGTLDSTTWEPTHTWTQPGYYQVSLTVFDSIKGCSDTKWTDIWVNLPPPIDFTWPPPPCAPIHLPFTPISNVTLMNYLWEFPGGVFSTKPLPTHHYTASSNDSVKLTVMSLAGCVNSVTKLVNVFKPVANIGGGPYNGCVPFSSNFVSLSTSLAPITSYNWNFGNGNSSTAQVVSQSYPNQGTYPLSLIITDTAGCKDTANKVVNGGQAVANFSMSHQLACPGVAISFANMSTGSGPINYLWKFGDGTTDTSASPTHTYNSPGMYSPKLIATSHGCSDSITLNINIAVPSANFSVTPDSASCPPMLATFTDQSTPPGSVGSWHWDFGDGSSSSIPNPVHLYNVAGTYDVTLIVTAPTGCADTLFIAKRVKVKGPGGNFTFAPDTGCAPLNVTYIANHQNTKSIFWDMGDGNAYAGGDTLVHTYLAAGKFFPLLILDDSAGCMVAIVPPDSVLVYPMPGANFVGNPTDLCANGVVQFTDQSVSASQIVAWQWNFGDASAGSSLQNPSHFYNSVGSYDVNLIVTTNHGCTDTITKPNYINVHPLPSAQFAVTDTFACVPWTVQFSDSSTATSQIVSWLWDFGDGSPPSVQPSPVHGFQNPGVYNVTLVITDAKGCIDTLVMPYNVPPPPQLTANAKPPYCHPATVQFSVNTAGFNSWTWFFGDGASGTGSTVTHAYANSGYYDVTIIGTNNFGCFDTLHLPKYVFIDSVDAKGIVDNDSACVTSPFNFFQQAYSDTTISSYLWKFGDGDSSTAPNPTHFYSAPGTYNVMLVVTSVIGCKDTFYLPAIDVYDLPIPPVVDINMVSVVDGQTVDINWASNPIVGFDHYTIYRETPPASNNWIPIDSFYSSATVSYNDQGINTEASFHCYKVIIVNECGYRSPLDQSPTHCTVEVQTVPQVEAIDVIWTPYVGWNSVDNYIVYKVTDYDHNNVTTMAVLPGNANSWRDSIPGCRQIQHSYRVAAIEQGGMQQQSWSDTSSAIPIYILDDNPVGICQATVVDDKHVRINWSMPVMRHGNSQILQRSTNSNNWLNIAMFGMNDTTYLDMTANVHSGSYYYRVIVLDSCSNQGTPSRVGRTIFLSGESLNAVVNLKWNLYEDWPNGVASQLLEYYDEDENDWKILDRKDSLTNFHDYIPSRYFPEICYRVTDFESGGNQCDSRSNVTCVQLGPVLFAPNAFTPNGDGLNDEFLLKGWFIEQFHIVIYNRWGELVYEGRDLYRGWDGTFHGKAAQEEVYVFYATAWGNDGSKMVKKGTVTLLR